MPRSYPLLALSAVLMGGTSVVASPVFAQTASAPSVLTLGSVAPKLAVGEWVKGKPVNLADGKLHVVDLWGTWCSPCLETIPRLTELSKKYAGKADFTGISIKERGTDAPAKVKAFVDKMGAKMDYHVARDDANGTIDKTWLGAAKLTGLPVAFVVDKTGKIVWIGDPLADGLDEALSNIIAGTYDMGPVKDRIRSEQAAVLAAEAKNAEMDRLFAPAIELAKQKKFAEAVAAINTILDTKPEYTADVVYLKYILYMAYDEAAGQAFAAKSVSNPDINPRTLRDIAWGIVAPSSKVKTPDYKAAVTIAEAAAKGSKEQDPTILDALSYAYEKSGNIDKAVEAEQKAVALLGDDTSDMTKDMKARLVELRTKQKPK